MHEGIRIALGGISAEGCGVASNRHAIILRRPPDIGSMNKGTSKLAISPSSP